MSKEGITHYEGYSPYTFEDPHSPVEKHRPLAENGLDGAVTNENELNQGFSCAFPCYFRAS